MKIGNRRLLDDGEQLTVQNEVPDRLFYVLSGEVITTRMAIALTQDHGYLWAKFQ